MTNIKGAIPAAPMRLKATQRLSSLPRAMFPKKQFHKSSVDNTPSGRQKAKDINVASAHREERSALGDGGSFDTVQAAACKIIELEAYLVTGVFFEILIETGLAALSEEESLAI
jgi:hypothetical protein